MLSRIISKYQPAPTTNAKKEYTPPPAFGKVSRQDIFTIAHSPKFGMFNWTSRQPTLTPDQQSALDAARNGRVDILDNIYQRTNSYDFLTGVDQEQKNILHLAARGNHESIIAYWKRLYDLLPNISNDMYNAWGGKVQELIYDRDNQKRTPLHWAAMNGHKAIVLNLLAAHAPVDFLDEQLKSAADLAENTEIAQMLREKMNKGFKDNIKDTITNFLQDVTSSIATNISNNTNEASTSNVQDTTTNPQPNISPATPNNDLNSDLRRLTAGRHSPQNETQVRNLLQRGANPNEQDAQDWRTALHWAVIQGHDTYVNLILKHNPDLALTDKEGYTALTWAEKQLENLKRSRRTPLKGEKNRRENIVRYLKKAYKQAKLVSSGESSPTIPPSSPHSSTSQSIPSLQQELDKRSLERNRRDNVRLNRELQEEKEGINWLQKQYERIAKSRDRQKTKKKQYKTDWKQEQQRADRLESERLSRLDKFEQEQNLSTSSSNRKRSPSQQEQNSSTGSSNRRRSSRSLKRIFEVVSPNRLWRLVQEVTDKRNITFDGISSEQINQRLDKIADIQEQLLTNEELRRQLDLEALREKRGADKLSKRLGVFGVLGAIASGSPKDAMGQALKVATNDET
jgi:ankyrin repeat protein